MHSEDLLAIALNELTERKAQNIVTMDVQDKTTFTDYMIVVTGTSGRHIDSLCHYVNERIKENGFKALGKEGDANSDWVLLDLGDVIVHAMTESAREYYQLEKLWSLDTLNNLSKLREANATNV